MGEIDKSTTVNVQASATATLSVKWIWADTVPDAPAGFERMPDFDLQLTDEFLGNQVTINLWAFKPTP